MSSILWSILHLKQTGKVKKLNKWEPHELTANQKNRHFEVSSSLILHMNHFSIKMHWRADFIQQPAQCLDQEEAPKHFTKPNLHQKNSWSLSGGLLPIWFTKAFWILAKPLHLRNTPSKLTRCTENCHACSQQWSTEGG